MNFKEQVEKFAEKYGWPVVIKADELFQGKGVGIAKNIDEAESFYKYLQNERFLKNNKPLAGKEIE
jgi:phosphoribosylamine-glycine ligase